MEMVEESRELVDSVICNGGDLSWVPKTTARNFELRARNATLQSSHGWPSHVPRRLHE